MEIKLQGFAELQKKLAEFGPRVEKNGMRAATRAAAVVFRDAIRHNILDAALEDSADVGPRQLRVHSRSGTLKANIVTNSRRSDGPWMVRYGARIKPGKKLKFANTSANRRARRVGKKYTQEGPAFYGKFLEYGTSKMRARPFMRPAFGPNVGRALEAFKVRLARAVELAAK